MYRNAFSICGSLSSPRNAKEQPETTCAFRNEPQTHPIDDISNTQVIDVGSNVAYVPARSAKQLDEINSLCTRSFQLRPALAGVSCQHISVTGRFFFFAFLDIVLSPELLLANIVSSQNLEGSRDPAT